MLSFRGRRNYKIALKTNSTMGFCNQVWATRRSCISETFYYVFIFCVLNAITSIPGLACQLRVFNASKVLLQTVSLVTSSRKSKMAATQTGSTYISAWRPLRNEIPSFKKNHVSGARQPLTLLPIVSDISGGRYSRWRPTKPVVHTSQLVDP